MRPSSTGCYGNIPARLVTSTKCELHHILQFLWQMEEIGLVNRSQLDSPRPDWHVQSWSGDSSTRGAEPGRRAACKTPSTTPSKQIPADRVQKSAIILCTKEGERAFMSHFCWLKTTAFIQTLACPRCAVHPLCLLSTLFIYWHLPHKFMFCTLKLTVSLQPQGGCLRMPLISKVTYNAHSTCVAQITVQCNTAYNVSI